MRIPWKLLFRWFGLSWLLIFAWRFFSVSRGPAFEYRDAAKSLPVIRQFADAGVTFFRDQDWSQVLVDREGAFANTDRSTCAITVDSKNVKPLEGEALSRWQRFRVNASRLPYAAMWLDLRYDAANGALLEAEIQLSTLGRESLIYSMGYTLPGNEPNEMVHTAIDADWYHRWEDWN